MEYFKKALPQSPSVTQEIRDTVSRIISDVEREGITAVRRYSEMFDGWNPPSFRLSQHEIEEGLRVVDTGIARAIDFAIEQVSKFARLQLATLTEFEAETLPGVTLGQKQIPVNAVGSYIPGGRYPLMASAVMTVGVPKVAGVKRVVATAPVQRGTNRINPAQLYAMVKSGADEIFSIGGAQALAAMAFGIEDSPPLEPVDMIVGAGNAYVAEAKRQLFGVVGIDLLAGPTEVCILADETASPEVVAADLLAQAEHGTNSQSILVTTSRALAEATAREIDRQLQTLPTAAVAGQAWHELGEIILVESDEEMVRVSDQIASEHLEVQTRDPEWFLARLTNYGSLFLGHNATVVYGDKGIGTNHVLPTNRAARYTGGLWVGKFIKTVTWQKVTDAANRLVAPPIVTMADAEGMAGHAASARLRLVRD
ncbi:histidinol dehydrogenase [Calidithermus roseus]|uniref:Sulfopropanediol 3-dehydrogenase n=1 Tax=Calidithermus roseus TaxID=1644118 RepID=A0A399EW75_9DEIN|nr:histidinol dehydrogenase [Calidithermus roseus]RIH87885.1 Sulfopropanediol 3-dehydrogenase [Calidithermus roseus]